MANVTARRTNAEPPGRNRWFYSETEIDCCGRWPAHTVCVNILRYTDDFVPRAISAEPNPLAQRFGRLAPVFASHILGYDGDAPLTKYLLPGEIPPG